MDGRDGMVIFIQPGKEFMFLFLNLFKISSYGEAMNYGSLL